MSDFLGRALRLKAFGYSVVPIRHGRKGPDISGWQNKDFTEDDLEEVAGQGYGDGNIGINTRFTPAVDIDVYDETFAKSFERYLERRFSPLCVRVGRAPKRLAVFRATTPFRKLSATYYDGTNSQKLEILGNGQQFVAYGVHPDTKKPYSWTTLDEPLNLEATDLPILDYETAKSIVDYFCEECERRGWAKQSATLGVSPKQGEKSLESYKPPLPISLEKIRDALGFLHDVDDYDTWLKVGCALHHQFQGGSEGLSVWHEWSAQGAKYDSADLDRRWSSFGRNPSAVTFATVLYRAEEEKKAQEEAVFASAVNRVYQTNDRRELIGGVAAALMSAVRDDLQYDEAAKRLQSRIGELSDGNKPRIETVRKILDAHKPKVQRNENLPVWCQNWVYVESRNLFYDLEKGAFLSAKAFDSRYSRKLMTDKNRANGDVYAGPASLAALNLYEIPTVYECVYLPGEERIVNLNGLLHVNTYNESMVPSGREPKLQDEKNAIRMVERHFEVLFPNDKERNLLLDYLAYTVQYPKEKITWGVLIQGVDGAGKSWMRELMGAVLGPQNVKGVDANALNERFTRWAEGHRMVFFEEIRLRGHNRFEILDKLRPYISNAFVGVRRMHTDLYEIPNVTNYVLFTNYIDALPINENDRRYFVLRTSFQTSSHVEDFSQKHPDYFVNLFNSTMFEGRALRWWLANRQISDDFPAKQRAPRTSARAMMLDESDDADDVNAVLSAIERAEHPLICEDIVSLRELKAACVDLSIYSRRQLGRLMTQGGFAKLGQFRLGGRNDPKDTWYTRHSERVNPDNALRLAKALTNQLQDDSF